MGDATRMTLVIRKVKKYYQLGFNYNKRWHHICHLGTPEKLLERLGVSIRPEYQELMLEKESKNSKKYQKNNEEENPTF
jgi:hypothetical protein